MGGITIWVTGVPKGDLGGILGDYASAFLYSSWLMVCGEWEIRHLLQGNVVKLCDLRRVGSAVDFLEVDFLDAVGAEGLHAGGARHGGGGDDLGLPALEEGTEIDLGMQHEFLPGLAILPEIRRGVEAWCEAVVGGGDDAVVVVEGGGADFSVWSFGAEAGDMGERHGVLGDAEAVVGHG